MAFSNFNIWEHSSIIKELYLKRARDETEEMTCAQQALELLIPFIENGDTLVDAGCGSGYFFHSLRKHEIDIEYFGFDQTRSLIEIGQAELPHFGLPVDRLSVCRLDDFQGAFDHAICMNLLSNIDNYHRGLERLLLSTNKTLILRESIAEQSTYQYVHDDFLDQDANLKVHVNTYAKEDIRAFIESYGFSVDFVIDRRTQGKPEMVIGYPHHWTFAVARKI